MEQKLKKEQGFFFLDFYLGLFKLLQLMETQRPWFSDASTFSRFWTLQFSLKFELVSSQIRCCDLTKIAQPSHTVAIWTFTFHEKSGCVQLIWKANFKPTYRPNSLTFLSGNSDLLYSVFFYFLQKLSNPVLFAHCCCTANVYRQMTDKLMFNRVISTVR